MRINDNMAFEYHISLTCLVQLIFWEKHILKTFEVIPILIPIPPDKSEVIAIPIRLQN